MKISFNLTNTGLGNQGGSLTLVKSGNALVDLGHEVYFVDSMKNQHTWTLLKAKHLICKNTNQIPDADVIISTGFKSVGHTAKLPKEKGLKMSWIRGWETWVYPENVIVNKILKAPTIKVVNSICLKNKLNSFGVKSKIIRPGNDFDILFPLNTRGKKDLVVGGLYHTKHKTKRSEWVIKAAQILKNKYKNLKLHMFGTNPNVFDPTIDKYISQPTLEQKNKFFNKIDVFLSPTNLEGLHIVPQEAMMTECCVVTTNAPMSGTQDYIFNGISGIISNNDFNSFVIEVDKILSDKKKRVEIGKNGRQTIEKLGDRKTNMEEFVRYIEYCKRT